HSHAAPVRRSSDLKATRSSMCSTSPTGKTTAWSRARRPTRSARSCWRYCRPPRRSNFPRGPADMANLIAKLSRATPSRVWNHWKFLKPQEELRQRSLRLAQRLASQQAGLQITAGPFEGMKYLEQVAGSALLPKLIGSYESELHAALLDMTRRGHRLIIDVGCAEGYYAVGM